MKKDKTYYVVFLVYDVPGKFDMPTGIPLTNWKEVHIALGLFDSLDSAASGALSNLVLLRNLKIDFSKQKILNPRIAFYELDEDVTEDDRQLCGVFEL